MSESGVKLPIVVEDRAALAELKKIQKELGNAGQESAKLNKQIEDTMKNMASKTAKAYGDMGVSLAGLRNKFAEFQSAAAVVGQAFGWAKQAVDLAKFSTEFARLERAIPAEKMRQLQAQTQGTVDKFTLLQRAAKEMGLSATAGLDDAGRRMQQTLAVWQNTVNDIKAGLGSIALTAMDWLDRLSDSLAGVDSIRSRRDQARSNAKRNIIDRRRQDPQGSFIGNAVRNFVDEDSPEFLAEVAKQDTWLLKNNVAADTRQQRQMLNDAIKLRGERSGGGWGALFKPSGSDISLGGLYRDAQMWNAMNPRAKGKRGTPYVLNNGADFSGSGFSLGGDVMAYDALEGFGMGGAPDSAINSIGVDALGGAGMGGAWGALGSNQAQSNRLGGFAAQDARLADFGSKLQDRTQLLGGAFGALSDGMAAAVDAAITGSESIGKAFLKASAAALKALAVESTVRAAYNTAMGIGATFLNPAAASGYFAAAGQFAITAGLAGVGAAALGAAGGSGGGASTRPSSVPGGGHMASASGGGGGGGGAQTVNVYVTGAISAGDHQKLGAEISKALRSGRAGGRVRDEQTITTRFE